MWIRFDIEHISGQRHYRTQMTENCGIKYDSGVFMNYTCPDSCNQSLITDI